VALRSRGIPYQLVRGLEFFKRREVRDVVAWLRLIRNPRDDEALYRVINVPARGIGRQSLDRLAAHAEMRRVPVVEAAAEAARIEGISKRAGKALVEFSRLHAELSELHGREPAVGPLLEAVLEKSGYRRMLEEEGEEDEEGQDRLANVEELLTAARQFDDDAETRRSAAVADDDDALGGFLEMTALVADTDAWDASGDRVALMTLHAAKGLEFPVVYLVALEDGILPHERSLDHPDQLEEERRLVFVGITRGKEEVCVSCGRIRDYRGTRRIAAPSLFLAEMTGSETEVTGAEAPPPGSVVFDPFGDAARGHEFDDVIQEPPQRREAAASMARQDGLVLELEDADEASRLTSRPRERTRSRPTAFETAADLAARMAGRGPHAHRFEKGQRVRHAEYGEGTISGISGSGPRAVGTVIFSGPAGTRKFILGHGALEPVE